MSWRAFANKWLILIHRWLGIGFCLLFMTWFVSGVVMMYVRMPRLTNEERLMRLPVLDFSAARLSVFAAAEEIGQREQITAIRAQMDDGRPAYRFQINQKWHTVFADNGEVKRETSATDAVKIVQQFYPEHAAVLSFVETLEDSDQWTLSSAIRRLRPLHKIALNDTKGTEVYVSATTGEVVLKTDSHGRFWGYAGAVIHWVYFTPLRRHGEVWSWTVIVISFAGSVMCLLGIIIGFRRLSLARRFHRGTSSSPYRGEKRIHHWFGLVFGLTTFTWILSGMFSMNPFDWSPGTGAGQAQINAVRGGSFKLEDFRLSTTAAQTLLSEVFEVKELELIQFEGKTYYLAAKAPQSLEATNWSNTDLAGYLSPETKLTQLIVDATSGQIFDSFAPDAVERVAKNAMPAHNIVELEWLSAFDNYYYAQKPGGKNLPILRAKYDDERATWLYIDPKLGRIVMKQERLSRLERWVYQGLHSLDLPVFYQSRPLWDIVLVILSLGGLWLSWTAVRMTLKRFFRVRTTIR